MNYSDIEQTVRYTKFAPGFEKENMINLYK
ncbi:hypothetical protein SDC9_14394 [bioreactor metagenome]|uniref:Uncharacterized protein n=1 Tax=bioreactor metagenome TaxID=1076179 RepID=A0A644TNV9_9ZZZZ